MVLTGVNPEDLGSIRLFSMALIPEIILKESIIANPHTLNNGHVDEQMVSLAFW